MFVGTKEGWALPNSDVLLSFGQAHFGSGGGTSARVFLFVVYHSKQDDKVRFHCALISKVMGVQLLCFL